MTCSALFLIAQRGCIVLRLPGCGPKSTGCAGLVWLFTREQRRAARPRILANMQLDSIKATIATVWVSAVCTAGIVGNVNTLSGWTVLAGVAVLPPLVMMWLWNHPGQTMSESIQEALQ